MGERKIGDTEIKREIERHKERQNEEQRHN